NGRSAPRLVLFSPIGHEDLKDRNLPDGKDNNARLTLYSAALAEIAAAHRGPLVNLFRPTLALHAKAEHPPTIHGIHLTQHGNELLAQVIDSALFKDPPEGKRDAKSLARLRQAVLDKNFHWFQRYRTTDGYSIYGGRAGLVFDEYRSKKKNTNREV